MKEADLVRAASEIFSAVLLFQAAPESQRPALGALRSQLLALLDDFAKSSAAQQARAADLEEARFALVAWIDETVNVAGWASSAEWERDPLQLQLFGTTRAGVEFFEHLDKLRPENADALTVYFYCLALGFRGTYAGREGDRQHILRRTHEKLRKVERALDLAREKRLTPAAYKVDIELAGRRGSRLLRGLLWVAAGTLVVFTVLWGVLTLFAFRVPLPGGA
jgi:type VI secretion system protein ImpK